MILQQLVRLWESRLRSGYLRLLPDGLLQHGFR